MNDANADNIQQIGVGTVKANAETAGNEGQGAHRHVRLSAARRTALLKALADPRRYQLLERVAKASCPLGCSDIRASVGVSAATLSHHIKELETAGLVAVRREGKFMYLSLRPGVLDALVETLSSLNIPRCTDR